MITSITMIAIAVITGLIGLAKRGRGKRRGRAWLKGTVLEGLALSTLATSTLLSGSMSVVNERTYAASAWLQWSIRGLTAGEGPIRVGLAHGDYSDAEIEAVLEATDSWNEGNLVAQEVARRKVREVGVFSGESTDEVLNDGKPIKTALRWILLQGQTLKVWAYNASGATLTTGAVVGAAGHVWLQPK